MSKPLIIIGNGGHASVLTEILLAEGCDVLGFTAPAIDINHFGLTYLGSDEVILNYSPQQVQLVLGIGMLKPSALREKIFIYLKEMNYSFKSVVHSSAIISPYAKLEEGVQIMAGTVIQTGVEIADNTIINTGAIIDHDCQIGSHVHVAPGSKVSGNVQIGNSTHIGTGATIIQGVQIGEGCLIGAGSVVVKNIMNHSKVLGVPAKEV